MADLEPSAWNRRLILGGGLALGGGLLLGGCGGHDQGGEPVLRVSITGKGEGDQELLQRLAGITTPGFKVNFAHFESGHLVIEALNSGALDYGGMSEIPPVFAAASAVQSFRQIAVLHGDVNNQVVLVPEGSRIETLADLKGKRVGYVRATTSQYFLIRMLRSAGLDWKDITPVAMGVSDARRPFPAARSTLGRSMAFPSSGPWPRKVRGFSRPPWASCRATTSSRPMSTPWPIPPSRP